MPDEAIEALVRVRLVEADGTPIGEHVETVKIEPGRVGWYTGAQEVSRAATMALSEASGERFTAARAVTVRVRRCDDVFRHGPHGWVDDERGGVSLCLGCEPDATIEMPDFTPDEFA